MTHLSPYQMSYNIQTFWVVAPCCWVSSCWWFEMSGNVCLMIQCHISEGLNLQHLYCESLRPGRWYKLYVLVWCVLWAEVSWYCFCLDLWLYACGGNIVVIMLYFFSLEAHILYTVNFCCEWPLSLALPSNCILIYKQWHVAMFLIHLYSFSGWLHTAIRLLSLRKFFMLSPCYCFMLPTC
jgi:hypothetical protein